MRLFGIFLIIVGAISAILFFLDKNFILFDWINTWGSQVGWGIRGFLMLLGIILFIVGKAAEEEEAEEEAEAHKGS
ncbi:MAG TPA: hypothetical protein VGK46_03640 [Saprospiraceae bacterium]|jgi:cell shape-determining protein MreC